MGKEELSREELFALVWEKPTVEVAKELGVSDVAVAKLCARLQVPKLPAAIGDLAFQAAIQRLG